MKTDDLIKAREQAEKAVASMLDGPMKEKAFEVILGRLLEISGTHPTQEKATRRQAGVTSNQGTQKDSTAGRILSLKEEGVFSEQRSITEIRDELRRHGWHYPLSSLSPRLVELVQRRMLRRELVKEGNKKIWKYSNP